MPLEVKRVDATASLRIRLNFLAVEPKGGAEVHLR